jgi:hypothetical protein
VTVFISFNFKLLWFCFEVREDLAAPPGFEGLATPLCDKNDNAILAARSAGAHWRGQDAVGDNRPPEAGRSASAVPGNAGMRARANDVRPPRRQGGAGDVRPHQGRAAKAARAAAESRDRLSAPCRPGGIQGGRAASQGQYDTMLVERGGPSALPAQCRRRFSRARHEVGKRGARVASTKSTEDISPATTSGNDLFLTNAGVFIKGRGVRRPCLPGAWTAPGPWRS